MKNLKIDNLLYLFIISVFVVVGCGNINSKNNSQLEITEHWFHFPEEDHGDTLVFVHDEELKAIRGGRMNFNLMANQDLVFEEQLSNDSMISKKGQWECNSDKNTLTFKLENTTTNFLILSLKNNKLKLKQIK